MKILQLIDEPWDSGLTAYALQVSELLQKAGQEVVLGVLPRKAPESMARERGLKTVKVESFLDARRVLRQTPWDVINVHTGRTHTWALLVKLLGGATLQSTVLVRTRGDARLLKVNPIFKFIYRRTDAVIAASEHVRKQYEEMLSLGEERARTIYPAVAVDEPLAPRPAGVVGIVGRLDVVKGHTVFLEAAAHILKSNPETRFLLAGKEAGVSWQLLENLVSELGIQKNVEFLGYVPSAMDLMRRCSVGVIASIGSEEVSRACLEWMAAGRPVVGTLVGCLPELIEPEETGLLVSPGDAAALSDGILRLIRDPALGAAWGENGRQIMRRKYSPDQFLHHTLEVYEWARQQKQKK